MNDREKLILAALLHDIGKFWQRAGESGKHSEAGCNFVRNYVPKKFQSSGGFIAYHHNPFSEYVRNSSNSKRIIVADWLSSGEREEPESEETRKPKITPLISIFSQISLNKEEDNNQIGTDYCYKLNSLSADKKTLFPTEKFNLSKENYKSLWEEFLKEIKNIEDTDNFDKYFNKLYYILQKYTWCIPSAVYKSEPDVSLFDHLKTTTAIVGCIYNSDEDYLNNCIKGLHKRWKIKQEIKDAKKNKEIVDKIWNDWVNKNGGEWIEADNSLKESKFTLIHGDISGVQNFIYNIKTKSAAKSLKGRSLFLVLLSRFIAEHILKELDLPITNLLFCGGGHFYILAPKLSDEKLIELRKDANEKLFKEFKTKLYLAIGKTDLCAKDFVDGKIAEKWKEVAEKTGKQKIRRYNEFDDVFKKIFSSFEDGGNKEICSICGSEKEIITKEEGKICKTCNSFIEFANYLKEVQDYGNIEMSKIMNKLLFLEQFNLLYNEVYSVTLQKTPFLNIPLGIPLGEHGIKTFEQLAEDWEEEKAEGKHIGDEKIGILKMDVDNLGKIFTKGFDKKIFVDDEEKIISKATISRMSALSSKLSLFFEGYLNKLIEDKKYKNHIYLIYAGGDDTFIVGRWDKVIELGYNIYNDFRKYTCENKDITISAGIVIVSPKYPLRKSADKAEEILEKAKNSGKNSIAIFDESLKWDVDNEINDFKEMQNIKKILVDCIDKGASKQLIQRVKGFDEWLDTESKRRKYVRLLKYYLYRNFKKKEENKMNNREKELWNKIEEELIPIFDKILKNNLDKDNKDKYNVMCVPIAARLAELEMKGDKK